MGDKLSSFPAQVALKVFSFHLNALLFSLILLNAFQIKFYCWLNLLFRK